ncbi:MAG: sugar transferase [Myxococcales bacterium]|nr:sugar transferase [Myxococcales bacterium]
MRASVRLAKRALDLVGAAVGLGLTAAVTPAIAAAIYLDSPGPIFYKQVRAGRLRRTWRSPNGRRSEFETFSMYKFRTMRPDAEAGTGAVISANGDPRITRVGAFLRKSRLDELPQFINVLRGDMSIVGPRPERPELLTDLSYAIPYFEERMRDVKPGITGLAQISLGYTGEVPEGSDIAQHAATIQNPFDLAETKGNLADDMRMKLLYDIAYTASLEKFSTYARLEAEILLKTPLVMLKMTRGR